MLRAVAVERAGEVAGSVTLPYDDRHRRRLTIRTDTGETVLLDLPEARHLHEGDRLVLEDGRRLLVRAAAEPVVEVVASDPRTLARLAWHLGNRHTPAQILSDRLRIRPDHVLEEMLARLGARLEHKQAAFDPEHGAYGHGHAHEHGPHAHDRHAHDHG
ncbi:MAG: urease accessory protein UreE [Geminicoccaceae bacterium]|nr:urease accessory protein UreE [Geminicoccaceae bacterium]MCX8100301.1 urease accessory protein UreE [Geminicoccaceae bacterium]MDW8370315.1 urease accessory protein UreE [Geminicoccaceae bacterium]